MLPKGILFLARVHGVLDEFMVEKEESSSEIVEPVSIKAIDPF